MEEEWGPIIHHNGGPRPVGLGVVIKAYFRNGESKVLMIGDGKVPAGPFEGRPASDFKTYSMWSWRDQSEKPYHILRYQIKKPKGLQILQSLLENLPKSKKATEGLEGLVQA